MAHWQTLFYSVQVREFLDPTKTTLAGLAGCLFGKYWASGSVDRQLEIELVTG